MNPKHGYSLALDTSQVHGQMLLLKDDKVVYSFNWTGLHSEIVTLKFQELCHLASIGVHDIKKIYCVCGPGSFTGCRVAVAFARTLAYSLGCPVVSINSLDLLSLNSPNENHSVLACIDAQRNSIFASLYEGKEIIFKNKLLFIENLDKFIKKEVFICGSGLERYKKFITPPLKKQLKQDPSWIKSDLGKYFKKTQFKDNEVEMSWIHLKPIYIRLSTPEEKRQTLKSSWG